MVANRATVNVRCNCGAAVPYDTSIGTNVAQCDACGKVIGLISVEGGPGAIEYTRPDGTKGAVPVQGYD
jgi:hypothetical protein